MFVAETQTFLSCLVLKIYSHHVSPRPSDKYVRQKTGNAAKGENASLVLYHLYEKWYGYFYVQVEALINAFSFRSCLLPSSWVLCSLLSVIWHKNTLRKPQQLIAWLQS